MATIIVLLLGYYVIYRLWRPRYEVKYKKKLRFRDMFNFDVLSRL